MYLSKILNLALVLTLCFRGLVYAQVGVGTVSPAASSILDLTSTTKGLLVPRLTLAQKIALPSPATGLLIYQTDGDAGFWYYTGTIWTPFLSEINGWSVTGNTGTVDGTNFIGTRDNIPFNIRVNNQKAGRIDNANGHAFLGYQSGNVNTGANNTFIGHQSGLTNTTGSKNTLIGSTADVTTSALTNAAAIGYNAKVATSNSMVLGGTGADIVNVGIGTTSPVQRLETMNGNLLLNNSNNTAAELRIAEPSTSGSNFTAFKTQGQTEDITYTLPAAQGSSLMVLTNDGTGGLTWTIGGVLCKFKATDESVINSTTLQDDNDFTFTVAANRTYEISGFCRTTINQSRSIKGAFVAPTGSTIMCVAFANRSAQDDITYITAINTGVNITPGGTMTNTEDVLQFQGTITVGGTAGTLKFQWAQNSSGTPATTIHSGSYMKLTMVN